MKRIVIVLILLVLATSVFAQTITGFEYTGKLSHPDYVAALKAALDKIDVNFTSDTKLPSSILWMVYQRMNEYKLEVGDVFMAIVEYEGHRYLISVYINKPDGDNAWEYGAWKVR